MKCRVWYRADGSVSVSHPDMRLGLKPKELTMAQWAEQQFNIVAEKNPELANLDFDDIEQSSLPADKVDRDRWRGVKGQGVMIDKNVILRNDISELLDDELAAIAPDPVKVIKLQRQLWHWKGK